MKRSLTVLLLSAGRRVALAECFRTDAAELGCELRLLAADMKPELSAVCALADSAFRMVPCADPKWAEHVVQICGRQRVDLVVPTIDTELEGLASISGQLAAFGTRAVIS